MLRWMLYWIWWGAWRSIITVFAAFTIQNLLHKTQGMWIETEPLLVGTACIVLVIIIWSARGQYQSK